MLVTVDADAFLTTSTFHHLNIKSHHLTISTPHHLTIYKQQRQGWHPVDLAAFIEITTLIYKRYEIYVWCFDVTNILNQP